MNSIIVIGIVLLLTVIPVQVFAQSQRSCNCVVFRFDDIQDYWIPEGQEEPLKVFEEKNVTVALGIIANSFGQDFQMVNATQEGVKAGIFEVTLHGWNHVSYANLSLAEQTQTMGNGSNLLMQIYGVAPKVFIPPFNDYNENTLSAMTTNFYPIISAEVGAGGFNGGMVYIAKQGAANVTVDDSNVVHMPQTIGFNEHVGGEAIKVSLDEIIFEVNKAVTTKGYAVIVLHPTDFVDSSESGILDEDEINDLERLIDILQSQGKRIVGFEDVLSFPR